MSYELFNSLASAATFTVIAASAIAAMIQLRHVRTSNQIALLTKLHDTLQSSDFIAARRGSAKLSVRLQRMFPA